jgi:hypothetical protein
MKSLVIILLTGLFVWSSIPGLAADPVAVLIKVKGDVRIKQEGAAANQKALVGAQILSGTQIQTADNSFVALKFIDDGSLVRIRANSNCTISGKKDKTSVSKNLYVEAGAIFSKITKQKGKYQVSTPTSVATVKGTIFWTVQKLRGETNYYGEEGIIELSNDQGSALLKAGETGFVASGQSKPIVRKTKAGEKPEFDDDESNIDDFEFEFKNESGDTKSLKFRVKPKE